MINLHHRYARLPARSLLLATNNATLQWNGDKKGDFQWKQKAFQIKVSDSQVVLNFKAIRIILILLTQKKLSPFLLRRWMN